MMSTPLRRVATFGVVLLVAWMVMLLSAEHHAPGSLLPHGYCFTWNPTLLWTHVVSDSLIGLAYISIPLTLLHLVRRRADMPFNWIVVLFATFIVSCGTTHWIEVWTVWNPDYWLSAVVKMITATASVLTAAALIYLVPKILAIPTVAQLNLANKNFQDEIRRRVVVEEELSRERVELERRVQERTRELAAATADAVAAHAVADEANRQKDRFLAKVSHELRTPLQSTLTWANVLKMANEDAARVATAVQRITHNVAMQARLIDDLLDISRILSGKMQLIWQPTDPIKIVNHAVDIVRESEGSSVHIETEIRSSLPLIVSDPERLEQVVWNLVRNAVQASSAGARVVVSLQVAAAGVRLEVRDSGRGIEPDELTSIFQPFKQGSEAPNRHRGLGLGLAIVQNIVTLLGGQISAHSLGTGSGATFTVVMPASPAHASSHGGTLLPDAAELDAGQRAALHGMRVLYVEDEADLAEGTQLLLASLGLDVTLCTTFHAAEQAILSGPFDLFLTDLMLDAGHSGLDLLPKLRATGSVAPALVLSAFGMEADRRHSLSAGFVEHLIKPVPLVRLGQALIRALFVGPARPDLG
jgi:signal transduction histidine kinase/ActR/RegA family two-component response regulator